MRLFYFSSRRKLDLAQLSWIGLGMSLLVSCGNAVTPEMGSQIDPAVTQCAPGTAHILVGDGFLRIICGCVQPGQTPGTTFTASDTLICNVAQPSTIVFFSFVGTVLQHQIVPTGPNQFVPTPVSDPANGEPLQVYAVNLPLSSATYNFQDSYSGLTGQIIVP
jgi:hypothetical protein